MTVAVTNLKGSPLQIVDFQADMNLREVSWNQRFLEKTRDEYKLKHGQAVAFCNCAKDRFRLVACLFNPPVLVLPPIDPADKISLYLKVAEFLRKFHADDEATHHIKEEISEARVRLDRRKKMAKNATKKRRR